MTVDLAVVGLGYVGLPRAKEAIGARLSVVGIDINSKVVDGPNAGISHIDGLTESDIRTMYSLGFRATTDEKELAQAETVVVCIPTPLTEDGGPDLGAVRAAMVSLARHLRRGMLVILESTSYPGTTDEVVRPLLEEGGLVAGVDFHLAFSPERIDPGNPIFNIRNTPKVVGGHTIACTESAAAFYAQIVDAVVRARGTREAETAKLLENTYRHVNIALVNEMARFCHELQIDLWDVIRRASTEPFGFQPFYPGPGVGGHCIPIDPNYLSHNVRARLGYSFSVRGASARNQRGHASLRGAPRAGDPQPRAQGTQRGDGAAVGGDLQGRHLRPTGVAGRARCQTARCQRRNGRLP